MIKGIWKFIFVMVVYAFIPSGFVYAQESYLVSGTVRDEVGEMAGVKDSFIFLKTRLS